ncbi:MAG: two-component regulator propeller domain-containing protein [Pseudomonadota bacterium]
MDRQLDIWQFLSRSLPLGISFILASGSMLRKVLPIVLSLLIAHSACATNSTKVNKPIASKVSFTHLPIEKLASIGYVRTMAQDKYGYIWFGGFTGLARYDGYSLEIFTHNTKDSRSLSNNIISDLKIDQNDNLWIATSDGVNRYNYTTGHFDHLFDARHKADFTTLGEPIPIQSLLIDKKGNLWIGTAGLGLVVYSANGVLTQHQHHLNLNDANVYCLAESHDGNIWLGMNEGGLIRFEPSTQKFSHYPRNASSTASPSLNEAASIWIENDSNIWVGTFGAGVLHFNPQTGLFYTQEELPESNAAIGPYIKRMYQTRSGELWIATDKLGVFRYQKDQKKLTHYLHNPESSNSLAANGVQSIFEDKAGDLWFGFHPSGIDVIHRNVPHFTNYTHNPLKSQSLVNDDILSVAEGKDGSLWIGTEKGMSRYNENGSQVQHFTHNPANKSDPNALPADPVLAILEDSRGNLWASTWGGGLSRYNKEKNTFVHYFHDRNKPEGISDDRIWQIYEDKFHNLWLGSERAGLSKYIPESDSFAHYRNDSKTGNPIICPASKCMYEDSEHNFWVGTTHGLGLFDRTNSELKFFRHAENDPDSLSAHWVKVIFEDSRHNLWVGTLGGGLNLFDKKTGIFKAFKIEDGLADNVVTGIQEDNAGFLWISGANGLSRLNTATMKFKNYDKRHGLAGNLFNRDANVKRRNGDLVFGSSEGLSIFNPTDIEDNLYVPPVVLANLSLFNHPVNAQDVNSPLSKMLSETKEITLTHLQSVFTFEFTALNYRFSKNNQYAYKLQGFDEEWNFIGNKRSATYTNLDPGNYIFQVKAANDEGLWNEDGTSLNITILPSIWRSWTAYTLYALALIIFVIDFVLTQRKKVKEAHKKVAMERLISERLRNIDKLKENFLANTSHELRTPLNGIIGLAESISTGYAELSPEIKQKAKMILYSGKRLANIVNDILEFSQLANNELMFSLSEVELRPLVARILVELNDRINDKSLVVFNKIPENTFVFSNDHRLSQIIHHIIDNAIKFTREGSITITHTLDDRFDSINVTDTGIGISAENISTIFTAFQQTEGSAKRAAGGAGLGLSVIQKMVELHKGDIQVESVVDLGTTFHIRLPRIPPKNSEETSVNANDVSDNDGAEKNKLYKSAMALEHQHKINNVFLNSHLYANEECVPLKADSEKKYKILVVDDDPVNRMVVKAHLRKQHFDTLEAIDGEDALRTLSAHNDIDLIILDVMMPHMTGHEVCESLRKHYSPQELPVIFLTANHQPSEIIKAFVAGGCDFITKPISGKKLIEKIKIHLSLLEDYRCLNQDNENGRIAIADPQRDYLRLSQAIANIIAQVFYQIPSAKDIGCWILNEGNNFAFIENLSTLPVTDKYALLAPQKIEGFLDDSDEKNDKIELTKGLIAAVRAGRLGDGFMGCKYVQCELIIYDDAMIGFIILTGDSAELMASEYKTILFQSQKHIVAAVKKMKKIELIKLETLKRYA